jgi:hypothetical protein
MEERLTQSMRQAIRMKGKPQSIVFTCVKQLPSFLEL